MACANEGSQFFTCYPHLSTSRMNRTCLHFQARVSPPFGWYPFPIMLEGGELGLVTCQDGMPAEDVTYPSTNWDWHQTLVNYNCTCNLVTINYNTHTHILHMLFKVKCVQWLSSFWPDEEKCWMDKNLPQIWRCNGPFVSGLHSSRLRCFFASSIHKLAERWNKCLNKLGGYVDKWIHNGKIVYI